MRRFTRKEQTTPKNTTIVITEVPAEQNENSQADSLCAAGAFTATAATPLTFPVSGKQLFQKIIFCFCPDKLTTCS